MNTVEKIDSLIAKIETAANAKVKSRYALAVQIVLAHIVRDLEEIKNDLTQAV